MAHFLLELRPSRPDLATSATPDERERIGAHFERLAALTRVGKLLLAGRSEDAVIGIAVLDVADRAEMDRIVSEDPALSTGLMRATIHPFRLALYGPRNG